MGADDIWRGKTDDEVLAAFAQVDDYTDEGQRILRAEIERRQLVPPATPPSLHVDAAEKEPHPFPRNPIGRLWAGGYSLPMAYWVWGWCGTAVWRLVLQFLNVMVSPVAAFAVPAALLSLVAFVVYLVLVSVGIWRSAGYYRGKPAWATLARVAIAAQASILVMRLIMLFLPQPL